MEDNSKKLDCRSWICKHTTQKGKKKENKCSEQEVLRNFFSVVSINMKELARWRIINFFSEST
jgi:hypothetical protein